METLKITPPKGFEIDKEKSTFEEIVFKPIVKELPKRWEDLGEISGCYTNINSDLIYTKMEDSKSGNQNIFATEAQARASLALAQLSQLREVYRNGWVPDWSDGNKCKYAIVCSWSKPYIGYSYNVAEFLSFETQEIAHQFLENFRDLIEEASPLLFG